MKGPKKTNSPTDGRNIAVAKCRQLAIEMFVSAIVTGSCRSQFHRTNDDGKRGPSM